MNKVCKHTSNSNAVGFGYRPLLAILLGCCALLGHGCGQSPHDVVARGELEQLTAMIDAEPGRIHERNNLGKTPLHYAVSYRRQEGITLLLERGADINAQDNTGMTALHVAAMLGRHDEAALLLAHDADALLEDSFGDTPLHTAAIHGQGQMVPLFVRAGVALEAVNAAGKTPLDLAVKHGHARLAAMLAERMGVEAPTIPSGSAADDLSEEAADHSQAHGEAPDAAYA